MLVTSDILYHWLRKERKYLFGKNPRKVIQVFCYKIFQNFFNAYILMEIIDVYCKDTLKANYSNKFYNSFLLVWFDQLRKFALFFFPDDVKK